jgi:hypothetical protein
MNRSAKRRGAIAAFLTVWMAAQAFPMTVCRIMQPAHQVALAIDADPAPRTAPGHDHSPTHAARHRDGLSSPATKADGPATGCCDQPMSSCCIARLQATVLASRDGVGTVNDALPAQISVAAVIVVPAITFHPITRANFLARPPRGPLTVTLQL